MPDAAEPTTFPQRRRAAVAEATERELAELRARLAEAEQRLAAIADLEEARREIDRLREAVAHRDAQVQELLAPAENAIGLREERDHLRVVLEQMKASVSWRVTAPLRRLKR
jgi:chromosome segregation ATPase